MKCLVCPIVILAATTLGCADEPSVEQRAKELIRLNNELVKALDAVKDRDAAIKAKPKVDTLRADWTKARSAWTDLNQKPSEKANAAYQAALLAAGGLADVNTAFEGLANHFPLDGEPIPLVEDAREAVAERKMQSLSNACESYYLNPNSNQSYPSVLRDLVSPPWGGASYVRNGATALLDPWGNSFQYATGQGKKGNPITFIWVERTVDEKTKVIGTKPPGKKK